MADVDLDLFMWVWDIGQRHLFVRSLAVFFGHYLGYVVLASLTLYFLLRVNREVSVKAFLFLSLAVIIGRGLIAEIIRFIFYRSRPFVALGFEPLIKFADVASFPSGHAVVFFAIAFGLLAMRNNSWIYIFIAAVLVSFGRIFIGVHWPSDIIGGFLVAILSVIIAKEFIWRNKATKLFAVSSASQNNAL